MNKFKHPCLKPFLFGAAAIISIALLAGCGDQNTSSDSAIVKSMTPPPPPPKDTTAPAADTATINNVALTLPVLDALFYEEGFEQELKTKLQLTDPQIEKLKTVSHESMADLSEDVTGEYEGSAREATTRSQEQIRGILGDEKANQLAQLVNQRYASGDVKGLMPTTPNSVPTDTRIVVNSPAYRMDIFQDGTLVKTYRVGIGYPEFPLPTGMRRAENIIFNPTWTPPDEPWVKGKFKAGKKVEAGRADNPLGPIKIPIGLPSLIHGGKPVARLGTFASHGCVGLTNDQVQDFAVALAQLSGMQLTPDSVKGYIKKKTETKSVKLDKAIPVELRYETIVAEDGGLRIYRDVYERGTNTLDNARRVLDVYGVSYESLTAQEKAALLKALTEMNRDAQGNAIAASADSTQSNTGSVTAGSTDSNKREDPAKSAAAKKGKVTNTIVGRKEIAVPIAALKGKGYPAPANLNTGTKVTTKGAQTAATARRR